MRALVAGLLAVLVLTGCSDEPEAPVEEPPTIAVTGAFGRPPVVSFETPLELTEEDSEVLVEGEGRQLRDGGPVLLALSAYDGDTGEPLPDRGAGTARTLLLTPEQVGEDVHPLLVGTPEGSRLLVTQPVSDDDGERMLVLVIDVLHTVAQGEELEPQEGMPTVTQDDDGVSVALPDTDPPASLEVDTVIRGDGHQVAPGQAITVQYQAVTWPGGDIYDSTWADGQVPRTILVNDTFTGLRDGLVDQTVGSRVLVVVPPELGNGTQTLVFAVDILAASDVEEDVEPN
ncbi:peptidylprolyl isomerase [Georgenia satyanarayanai]|uniref:Peptidyl-prolyl cis-trans isomerase n=1 Tax=Georgenia satyanarayanai TaxID=860221 RepID=A0A2Y9C355_9MICO|nr:FKBP-type peptidyl-prolyl cis-trans isomerase [Georgenia satyanarayanai]PYG02353.1 peptidylprolyl isomerase [Georgenia satyanarayanai]SSA37233.1 peptidylprolyl isomerase [Georgenia satyanarayanai]